jgi:hypothetical protein
MTKGIGLGLGLLLAACCLLAERAFSGADGREPGRRREVKWIAFPDERLQVCGLPWLKETAPDLWRFPRRVEGTLPKAVQVLMRFPTGARIRFASNTSQLRIRFEAVGHRPMGHMSPIGSRGLDVYVGGACWSSVAAAREGAAEAMFFQGADRSPKEMTVYLPIFQELRVVAIGVDADAELKPPAPFALKRPVVFYGSSIAQGACACRPGMTYAAILARKLNVDFVNLGFSGSGKAEPEVVDLVAAIDACGYVFDLGKSFRMQPPAVYAAMLAKIRAAHPDVPMVCVTPIFSTRELYSADYMALSRHVRAVMRQAAASRTEAGDRKVVVVKGLDLLGPADADAFQEGVHPTDLGFARIAERLEPTLRKLLLPPTD